MPTRGPRPKGVAREDGVRAVARSATRAWPVPAIESPDRLHRTAGLHAVAVCPRCGAGVTLPRVGDDALTGFYPDDYGPYRDRMTAVERLVSRAIRAAQGRSAFRRPPFSALRGRNSGARRGHRLRPGRPGIRDDHARLDDGRRRALSVGLRVCVAAGDRRQAGDARDGRPGGRSVRRCGLPSLARAHCRPGCCAALRGAGAHPRWAATGDGPELRRLAGAPPTRLVVSPRSAASPRPTSPPARSSTRCEGWGWRPWRSLPPRALSACRLRFSTGCSGAACFRPERGCGSHRALRPGTAGPRALDRGAGAGDLLHVVARRPERTSIARSTSSSRVAAGAG